MSVAVSRDGAPSNVPTGVIPPGSPREQWVDAVKGTTIVLVVLHHVVWALPLAGLQVPVWMSVDLVLGWVRMPLFFLVSGLFARAVVHGPSRRLWRNRVGRFAYLFGLWAILHLSFYSAGAAAHGGSPLTELEERLGRLLVTNSELWFIEALAIFFAIAFVLRRAPRAIQVLGSAVLSAVVLMTRVGPPIDKLWLLVFFLLGCHYRDAVLSISGSVGLRRLGAWRPIRGLRWLGTRTLPIYLMHVPPLSVLWVCPPVVRGLETAAPVAPVLLTAYAVVVSLLAYRLLHRVPGLFDLPLSWSADTNRDAGHVAYGPTALRDRGTRQLQADPARESAQATDST